ncbi:MAG: UPF0262 family protein [Defluviicoccus sp.]|nr:UPF0262 family protein [Defluviicoccus sp.]MDE0275144.1 UPF0262 family protein [Defluviicoccus sp.]
MTPDRARRLENIVLDDGPVIRRSREVEREREVAVFDLLEANDFALVGGPPGPYSVTIGIEENRLVFDVRDSQGAALERVRLSLAPFRGIVRDYFTLCEAYYEAIKTASLARIEAIDMGRRSMHDEGAELLRERLADAIEIDADTARRLFTLVCVLHVRG